MKSKVLITGGSGLVGSHLSAKLHSGGYEVVHLSRSKNKSSKYQTFRWDIDKGFIEDGAFENVSHIIHLAGAGIADKRWSDKRKKELTSSRIKSANLIFSFLKTHDHEIETFISASATGIYGCDTGSVWQTEDQLPLGDDFLAKLTKSWESAADQFSDLGLRIVKLRMGLVLDKNGGLINKLLPMANLSLGSAFGSGKQFMSWIHINDLSNIFIKSIERHEIQNVYNAVAPNPLTNKEFVKQLSKVLGKPYFLPNTPSLILKLVLGELSSAILGGIRVSSKKIEEAGYKFQFAELRDALGDLLSRS